MKNTYLLLLVLFLTLGTTSCDPDKIAETRSEQQDEFASDPNSEEAGEDDELEPNS